MNSLPRVLYKYFPPDRLDVIEQHSFRFTQLGAFNDPFEGRPSIAALAPEPDMRGMLRNVLPDEVRQGYALLAPDIREALSFETFERIAYGFSRANESDMVALLAEIKDEVQASIFAMFDKQIGVFSLSEVPDSLLMWSHYAASHTGFALGMDPRDSFFDQRTIERDDLRHLRRVVYRESRPREAMTNLDATELFLVKSGHWAYEREWRMLLPLRDADRVIADEPYPIHLFGFPDSVLREVILGARATKSTRERVIQAIKSLGTSPNVRIRQAVPDEHHFLLRFEDVSV